MAAPRFSSAAPTGKVDANGPATWQIMATCAGIAVYVGIFYQVDPRRRLILSQILVPEELISSWVDGDWSRFGLFDHFAVLAGAAAICLISGLTGWLVLHGLRLTRSLDAGEQMVIGLATGLNVWSLLTLAVGLAGGLPHRTIFAGLALSVLALAVWKLPSAGSSGTDSSQSPGISAGGSGRSLSSFGWLPLMMCLPLTLVILLGGTMPATHFDVREYHLQVPKEWYQQGKVTFLPHNVYGNMPLGAEMHAILGMLLTTGKDNWWWGALVGKSVIAAFAPLAAAGVFLMGRRWISSDAGAWGAFAYLSNPWIGHVSMTGLIDGAVAAYVVTSVMVAYHALARHEASSAPRTAGGKSFVGLAGFLAGGAVSCKYPPLLFLVVPLGLLILFFPRGRIHWKSGAILALGVAAGCGLWFAKNWALTGNPTYPLLYSWMDGKSWDAEKDARWTKAHGPPRDADGNRYTPAQVGDSLRLLLLRSDHHGPWLIPLAAAAFWAWPRRNARKLLLFLYGLVAVAVVCWWLLTHRVDRFLVPMLPLLAVGAGMGATWTDDSRWRRAVVAFGLFAGMASFLQIASPYGADNRFLIALTDLRSDLPGSEPRPLTRMNDGHRWLNEVVEPGNRVLLVGEAQVFDLEMPILYNTCFDDCVFEVLFRNRSRAERLKLLRDLRISHIFVSWYELDRYRSPGNYGYSEYPTRELFYDELVSRQRLLRPVPHGRGREVYDIFEVVDSELPRQSQEGEPSR